MGRRRFCMGGEGGWGYSTGTISGRRRGLDHDKTRGEKPWGGDIGKGTGEE